MSTIDRHQHVKVTLKRMRKSRTTSLSGYHNKRSSKRCPDPSNSGLSLRGGLGLRYRKAPRCRAEALLVMGQTGVGINRGRERPDLSGPAPARKNVRKKDGRQTFAECSWFFMLDGV